MSTYASAKIIKNHLRRKQGCCPEKALSFSAQLRNCNLDTCWHIELSISQTSPPFIQHLIRAIGRKTRMLYGKSFVFLILCAADKLQCWIVLAQHTQDTQPYPAFIHSETLMSTYASAKSSKIRFVENKDAVRKKALSFSAQLTNCNVATCWHIELSILSLLHLSFIGTIASVVLSSSFKNSAYAGLGPILAVACATT